MRVMRDGRRRILPALLFASSVVIEGPAAWAQATGTPKDELASARALFAEALRDEEAQRFSDALEKFERVRAVRDTASIEYRIGACYEGLGQRPMAFEAYREATVLGQRDPQGTDVVTAAADRLQALSRHVGQVTLVIATPAPADLKVRIDDGVVSPLAASRPVPLEPGSHVVVVTARGAAPFRSEVVLSEGAQASLPVSLVPLAPAAEPGRGQAPASAGPARTVAWATVIAGGALLATSAVLFVLRGDDISALQSACPGGICRPGSDEPGLSSTRNRALAEGPMGVAFGIAGLAAAGAGAVLLLTAKGTGVAPLLAPNVGGVAVTGVFR
jgi:hypothetical protein